MFAKIIPPPTIKFIRGNTYNYTPALKFKDEDKTTVSEGESVVLIVKSSSGKIYYSCTISGEEGIEKPITFDFSPKSTIKMAPYRYVYSIDLYTGEEGDNYYTLEKGFFHLLPNVGSIEDLGYTPDPDDPDATYLILNTGD